MARKNTSSSGALRWRKDGTPIVNSPSHVAAAEATIKERQAEVDKRMVSAGINGMLTDIENMRAAVNAFVVKHYDASDGYEDDQVKLTKVVGHTRSWNADKLEKLMPRALWRKVIKVTVDTQALDQLVRDGQVKHDKIAAAFEEVEKTPYVKRTEKSSARNAEADAAALQEALA